MASQVRCPKCGGQRSWTLKDGRYRCAYCRYDWRPGRLPLRLTIEQWRAILRWFVRGLSSAHIAQETRLDRKRVLRALTSVRRAMTHAAPADVRRAGGNRPEFEDENGSDARGSVKTARPRFATLELYAVQGQVWARVMPEADAEWFGRSLGEKPNPLFGFPHVPYRAGIVYRGRLYRTTEPEGRPPARFGRIEAFWAYLQRQLRSKGGIRRARLGLYLAEYAWRYNHRKLSSTEQLRELLALIRAWKSGGEYEPFPHADDPGHGPIEAQA